MHFDRIDLLLAFPSEAAFQTSKSFMTSEADIVFMRIALEEAMRGAKDPGGAEVGCVLVRKGVVAEIDHNQSERLHDPTAHSEMVAIRSLCRQLRVKDLRGYTLYCTLQPCGMCTLACVWAGISRIVYGSTRKTTNAVYFETQSLDTEDLVRDCFRNDIMVERGVLEDECRRLYFGVNEVPEGVSNPAHQPSLI